MGESESAAKANKKERWKTSVFRWAVFTQLLILFIVAYIKMAGLLLAQTNYTDKDMFGGDQMHNMRIATWTKEDLTPDFSKGVTEGIVKFFPHRTDGVVQPLWPWIAAWFTTPGHEITEAEMVAKTASAEDIALFNRGRWFNVFLTATFLVCLGIAACRIFSLPAACNLVLLGGFGALLPRAVYFQPEPLYFIFFFLTWVACICALKHNSLWIYAMIGILSGIAYMAKSSVHPLLAGFIVVSSLRCLWEMITASRSGLEMHGTSLWHWRNHLVGLVMLAVAHLMTTGPRLTESYEKFGSMTHSYPAYWMWMDRFEPDCFDWMVKHSTKESLVNMSPEEKPSLKNYLRTHSEQEVKDRLWNGTKAKLTEFFIPKQTKRSENVEKQKPWRGVLEWRGAYLGWLAALLGVMVIVTTLAVPKAEHVGHVFYKHGTGTILLFVVCSFVGYALSYGWYHIIGRGDRFMMSLYLPVVFTFTWAVEGVVQRIRRRHGNPWIIRGYQLAQWTLFAAICWRLFEIFRSPFFYN